MIQKMINFDDVTRLLDFKAFIEYLSDMDDI